MRILFICRHNVFRSRVSESYFKKINKNKNIKVKSAGIFKGTGLSSNQVKAIRKKGIPKLTKPKTMSVKKLKKTDLIILTANDIPISLFNNKSYIKKVINWNIPDVLTNNYNEAKKSVNLITKKVKKLVKDLEHIKD